MQLGRKVMMFMRTSDAAEIVDENEEIGGGLGSMTAAILKAILGVLVHICNSSKRVRVH